jgi:magnesium-protoporphyrin O-methyltransferase
MSCCTPTGYRTIFGGKTVERDARRYHRKGLTGSARWLLHALTGEGVSEASVLEVGGGIGGLQIELLHAGATHATNVEIIDSYEAAAAALIADHGVGGQVERHIADFAEHPDETPVADIVIMHRVICCYPDPDALITAACDQARERVAITIPRQAWWVKLGFASMNAWFRLRRVAFKAYVHPLDRMLDVAASRDFHTTHHERDRFWESIVLQRRTPAMRSATAR